MTGLQLVPSNALAAVEVALSVSDTHDLARLGLDPRHVELAVGELTRGILLAEGRITYGGRLRPSGFTHYLMSEVRRYGTSRPSVRFCLALPEHQRLPEGDLDRVDRDLGMWGSLVLLDRDGNPVPLQRINSADAAKTSEQDVAPAYSSLRRYISERTDAQVLVGGQLRDFQGHRPGVLEELAFAIAANHPCYLAAGFGGATAAALRVLNPEVMSWLPNDLPIGWTDDLVVSALDQLRTQAIDAGWSLLENGLTQEENAQLAASHRPGEIASLVVLGLSRAVGSR